MPFGGRMNYGANYTRVFIQRLTNPTRFVVQYNDLDQSYYQGHFATFQVILYSDGTILTQYESVDPEFPPQVVGIENNDGTIGLDYGTNVYGGLAVAYYLPGGNPSPTPTVTPTATPTATPTVTPAATPEHQLYLPLILRGAGGL